MTPNRQSSLLIAVPEIEDLVADWRAAHDPGVAMNIDCHITILFPFVPADLADDELIDRVQELVSDFGAFDFQLTGISEFPGVLWLKPEPDDDLKRLMRVVRAEFPEYPPYEGEHLDTVPHLTVAMVDSGQRQEELKQEIANDLAPSLPIACQADNLGLYTSDGHGMWSRHTSIPLERSEEL